MKKIPGSLRREMSKDPFYYRCCITRRIAPWTPKVEWHHNLMGAHGQVNEKWCILPLAKEVHADATNSKLRMVLDWIMLNRGTDEELKRHSKAEDLIKKRERLNAMVGFPWYDGIDVLEVMFRLFPVN